jgi:hypothetical protein
VRRRAPALLFLVFLTACGKKGDPLPPLRPTPAAVAGLRVAQRGDELVITFTAPRAGTDGGRLPVLDLELFVAEGDGDFLKLARVRRFKAAPGEAFTETAPLPATGTALRVAARAIARGHRGSLGEPARLLVTAPLAAPTDLTARVSTEGVILAWRGDVPAPLPTPTPATTTATTTAPATTTTTATAPTATTSPATSGPAAGPTPPPVPSDAAAQGTSPPATTVPAPTTPPATAPPAPKPTPTPKPFVPGFFIFRRAPEGHYGSPLRPEAVAETAFLDAARPGESWCYVVRAVASATPLVESAPSNEACAEAKDLVAPAAPTGLTAVAQEKGVELRWSAPPDTDVASYRVYRRVGRGGPEPLADLPAPATRFLDEAPPEGLRLRYQVSALDGAGNEGPRTLPVDVTRP